MHWRLGLDVGTASVGAVAVELGPDGEAVEVPWHLVRIFQEPNDNGQTGLTPKKAARRLARQQRRQIERRKRRIRKIAHLAPLLGLVPSGVAADGEAGRALPLLRAKAARERVELPDLLRILLRMAKRRGYAGGFRAVKSDKELGVVQQGSSSLREDMAELARKRGVSSVTLGEYLWDRVEHGLPVRLKVGREDVPDRFALREMVREEFDQIWATQRAHHSVLDGVHEGKAIKAWFADALFFQRPLKSVSSAVGLCPLEQFLPRAPRAQMAAQAFRIEKTLGDLRWGAGARAVVLTPEQRAVVRDVLNTPSALTKESLISFKKLYKVLDERGCPGGEGKSLNIDRASREELKGNSTLKAFDLLGLLEPWQALQPKHQVAVINLLADLGSPEQLDSDDWHRSFLKADAKPGSREESAYRRFAPEVIGFVNLLRNNSGYGRLGAMNLEGGRMAYSVKALNRLTEWLREPSWKKEPGPEPRVDEDGAIRECYPDRFKALNVTGRLPPPPKTGNDTVDVALAQVRVVVRDALRSLGCPPSEVIVEFGREVGLGPAKRNEWEKDSARNQKDRRRARKEIEDAGRTATRVAIRRYLYWHDDQSTHCPYCEKPITLGEALDGQATHIEHIIPRSLTQVGQKRSEVVLAHAECNTAKGNRTPWKACEDVWGMSRWNLIEARAEEFRKKRQFRKARLLLLKDFEQEVLTDSSIEDFVDRQLHQTSWIAREAAQWLRQLCPDVFAARGEFTAMMRRSWHLDTVIPEVRIADGRVVLDTEGQEVTPEQFEESRDGWEGHGRAPERMLEKRLDHRHHVVDALVIAQCDRKVYFQLAENYKAALASGVSRAPKWQVEPPLPDIRQAALRIVGECRISQKPDRYVAGRFFQDTAYSEVKGVTSAPGKGAVAKRALLVSLVDEKSVERTRANIDLIASAEVRDIVRSEFEVRLAQGKTPKEALAQPVAYPRYGTQIREVRVIRDDVSLESAREIRFTSRQGQHSKLLLRDGNAYLEVRGEGKKIKAQVVALCDAAVASEKVGTGVRRFFKADTVIDSKDRAVLVVKQIKSVKGGTLILVPIFESRPVADLKARDGLKNISGSGLSRLLHTNVCTSSTAAGGRAPSGD